MANVRLQQRLKTACTHNVESHCWDWYGQISNSGHGRISIRDPETQSNKMISAETASYLAFIGEIPKRHLVRQCCGNRLCINPEHLELFEY